MSLEWLKHKLFMPNYYEDLRNRAQNYHVRFSDSPKKAALRMIWWNFKSLFKRHTRAERRIEAVCIGSAAGETENRYIEYIHFLENQKMHFSETFVPLAEDMFERREQDTKIIAWYLPQYYQMEVNDRFHGRGFTEWTKTTQAIPLYTGHYQPHVPYDVGYYNLNNLDTMKRQVELAKQYGIYGFCFHWYWFSGKRTMEKPVEMYLAHPELNLPFCFNWANENWTSAWDGGSRDLIFEQRMDKDDEERFIHDLLPYFRDKRYIRIDGRPVLSIYYCLTFPKERFCLFLANCRKEVQKAGFPDLYIMLTTGQGFNEEAQDWGADALVEYPAVLTGMGREKHIDGYKNPSFCGQIRDYRSVMEAGSLRQLNSREFYRAALVGFDNSARKASMNNCVILSDAEPAAYKEWLKRIVAESKQIHTEDTNMAFVLAWNEWAEAAHLEPDMKYGYGYLQATREALEETRTLDETVILEQIRQKREKGITALRFYIHCVESLGDIIACEPIARYLKDIVPECRTIWIVKENYQEIVRYNPFIDEVVTVDCLGDSIGLCDSYRKQEDSLVIDCHYDGRWCTKTKRVLRNPNNPMVNEQTYYNYGPLLTSFCLSAGLPALKTQPAFYEKPVARVPEKLPETWIVIQCVSSEASRDWEGGKWNTLTESLTEKGYNIVELGLHPVVHSRSPRYYDCTDVHDFHTIAQIIKRASCFIGIDSAFAHLANCYQIPGVIILGSYKNFNRYVPYTGGYGDGSAATLLYAENASASEVPVQQVFDAVLKQISEKS